MNLKITFTATFQLQNATGPNLKRNKYEVIDASGDRLSYVDSIETALADVRDMIDPEGALDGLYEVEES